MGRYRPRSRTLALVSLCSCLTIITFFVLNAPSRAHATNWTNEWDITEAYPIYLNADSFSNLDGLSLSYSETIFWVKYATHIWRQRTGVTFEFWIQDANHNSKSLECNKKAGENVDDDYDNDSEIAVVSKANSEQDINPQAAASTERETDSNGDVREADICIWEGGSAVKDAWAVKASKFPKSNLMDLVKVMVHELGHALGSVGHEDYTVMDPSGAGLSTTRGRYPYGHDVQGIHSLWGDPIQRQRRWQKWDWENSEWLAPYSFAANKAIMYTTGDIGYTGDFERWQVISTSITATAGDEGARINWSRQDYPLSPNESWTNRWIDYPGTWRPPGIAGGEYGLWVTAWTNSYDNWLQDCFIRVGVTTDAFDSLSVSKLANSCTLHQPALAYDYDDDRFVLVYSRDCDGEDNSNCPSNDQVYARTSTDGTNWTSPQDLGFTAPGGPSVSCDHSGDCLISYMDPDDRLPRPITQHATVDSNGNVELHSSSGGDRKVQDTPMVDETWNGSSDVIFLGIDSYAVSGGGGDANGDAKSVTSHSSQRPMPFSSWEQATDKNTYRGDPAGSSYREKIYYFTVD